MAIDLKNPDAIDGREDPKIVPRNVPIYFQTLFVETRTSKCAVHTAGARASDALRAGLSPRGRVFS